MESYFFWMEIKSNIDSAGVGWVEGNVKCEVVGCVMG